MISQTWVVQKANLQSAWSKSNSAWGNLTNWWGRPTAVHYTSGRMNGCQGLGRKGMVALCGGWTIWTTLEMDQCTVSQHLQTLWWHSRTACCWKMLLMLDRLGSSGFKSIWRNVQVTIRSGWKREVKAKSNGRWIWKSRKAETLETWSWHCQMRHAWLSFTVCRMSTITSYPPYNS